MAEDRHVTQLEDENAKLERLVADLSLDNVACRKCHETSQTPRQRRGLVGYA